ncbi:copper-activated transcription factor grisea [Blastomyces dermatitidis ATCC 18188]|uniref:Copper-activated transcription factor grisea n=1 Tax=Ajellomyces dermatitidis (strain ATCC 18188 / CBS 674.68) TaxID=653446 RepID=F2T995_AJEDA|nr:copper-activated transcription factor grisea [Blastomyces dermatitidis ATCC 18188]
MPLDEQGAKWSCEPCVRGHRSSKCQHFDRLMMKVPKAGRPLAKCPHPKGTCSCQKLYAFMVRIPKGSTCLCRPLYQVPMMVTEAGPSAQPTPGAPAQIPPTTSGRNRIQKRARRQSSLQKAPELVTKSSNGTDVPSPGYKAEDQGPSPIVSNIQSPYNERCSESIPPPAAFPQHQNPNSGLNGQETYPTLQSLPHKGRIEVQPAISGGCSGSQPTSEPSTKPPKVSCCTKNSKAWKYNDATPQLKREDVTPSERPTNQNSVHFVPQYPTTEQQSFPTIEVEKRDHDQNNTSPHLPHTNPFANSQLHEASSAPVTGYSSPNPMSPYDSLTHPMGGFPSSGMHPFEFQTNQISNDSQPHNCDCGDDCQCLGCASHPYNNTTRQHIQQMGYMITSGEADRSPEPNNSPTLNSHVAHGSLGYNNDWPPSSLPFHSPGQIQWNFPQSGPPFDNPGSSVVAPAIHDPNQNQLLMQPAAYYELEYSVGLLDPCTNMTGTCQCGANCSCVGCLTHNGHDGIPLELPQTQDNQTEQGLPIMDATTPISPIYNPSHSDQPPVYTNHYNFAQPPQSPVPIMPLPV